VRDLAKRTEHLRLLNEALALETLSDYWREAFEQMRDCLTTEIDPPRAWAGAGPVWQQWALTEKQEARVRRELGEEVLEPDNRFTDGPVPRGKEVEMAEVLKKPLPMKPPGRK
jgi:hypothetical protein